MTDRLCIDLFSGTDGFSAAFIQSREWDVISVDNRDDHDDINPIMLADVFDLTGDDFPTDDYDVTVVLASPPCKAFSMAAAGHHMTKDVQPKTDFGQESLELIEHTIDLIRDIDPEYWFLENPRAGLRRVMRRASWGLGEPTGTVSWCQYGANRMKPTDLWGIHPPMRYRFCANGEDCHVSAPRGAQTGTNGMATDVDRAAIPFGLSIAILDAVERALSVQGRM
jgi:hypothetical protein